MATKKKLLQAAAGTAAASGGAAGLNVEQVFSTYLYDGNGNENVIDNGINLGQSNDGGSGIIDPEVGNTVGVTLDGSNSGLDFGTGDFTFELFVYHTENSGVANNSNWDIYYAQNPSAGNFWFGRDASTNVVKCRAANMLTGTTSIPLKQWSHIAVVMYNGVIKSYLNGVEQTSETVTYAMDVATNTNPYIGNYYSGSYGTNGRISNFRIVKGTALYTSNNFTVPTSPLTDISGTVFLGFQDEGPFVDNSSNSITVTDQGGVTASTFGPFDAADAGEGGLVWIKGRDTASKNHQLADTERGAQKTLISNENYQEFGSSEYVKSFNASGFTVGNNTHFNDSSTDYASWTFRKAPKFFDVVTYTGTGSSLTIDHNLGVEPAVIIIKRTNTTGNWIVFTDVVDGTVDYLFLDATDASTDGSTLLSKTSTDFTLLQSFTLGNASGSEYVAYLFAHNNGDGDFGPTGDQDIIKCGSYTGTGSEMFIDLGFEPQWILTRRTDTTDNWFMVDTMRGIVSGGGEDYLWANTSNAEQATTAGWAVNPTGFTVESASRYASGGTYIYIAIRRGPMAVPTDATDVFAIDTRTGSEPSYMAPFEPDMAFKRNRNLSVSFNLASRLTGTGILDTASTGAESSDGGFLWDYMNGWANDGGASSDVFSWMWKRAPSFCDVVAYTGNGTAGRTVSHNLGVAPEMMWVKSRTNTYSWSVYHKGCNGGVNPEQYRLVLNDTHAETANSTRWNDTAPTESVFTLGTATQGNASGEDYIAYLFASLDGVSKVGSFSHTSGSNTDVDCGFSNGARFVLIKRTDNIGHWITLDTERGIVTGNDAWLSLNLTSAENTSYDLIDPLSSGFTVDGSGLIGTGDYIFYAIA